MPRARRHKSKKEKVKRKKGKTLLLCTFAFFLFPFSLTYAQTGWYGGRQWKVRRSVNLQPAPQADGQVCVVEFFSHGEFTPEQPGLLVVAQRDHAPFRVLQQGPGDFVRLAFQTVKGKSRYEIYYGGTGQQSPPEWTASGGLLLEVRKFGECDLMRLDSVREAFERAEMIGRDYVPIPSLGGLPMADSSLPVLTRLTGSLRAPASGKYRFCTSSRDASWLLIDGKQAVAWPGRHGPVGQVRHVGDIELTEGVHRFEYHLATMGGGYMAVAAWQPPRQEKVTPIPAEAFGTVRRATTEGLQNRTGTALHDFFVEPLAEAVWHPSQPPLVKVRFLAVFRSPESSKFRGSPQSYEWDFGDGQSAKAANPEHIYLLPGEYTVRCLRVGGRTELTNRIEIAPPWQRLNSREKDARVDIAEWAPILSQYDPTALSADSLRQMVSVHRELEDYASAVTLGLAGIESRKKGAPPLEPQSTATLAELLSTLSDRRLNKPADALRICDLALATKPRDEPAARLWLLSAELALKLGRADDCLKRLVEAGKLVEGSADAKLRLELALIRGDYHRRKHQGDEARKAFAAAEKLSESERWDPRHRIALTGVHSRAVEQHLAAGRFYEADEILRTWSRQMPSCRLDGYYSLLRAQHALASGRHGEAVFEVEDSLALGPDTPYADRLLLVAAEAQARLGNQKQSQEFLNRLIRDYPGSPDVTKAKKRLAEGFPIPEKKEPSEPKPKSKE